MAERLEKRERLVASFLPRVERTETCWLWTGPLDPDGYARADTGRMLHRLFYQQLRGPIPDGLTIDHLCRVRHCQNPEHLEVVTVRENTLRGNAASAVNARRTHCVHGHAFDEANTYVYRGTRGCRACNRRRVAARRSASLQGATT